MRQLGVVGAVMAVTQWEDENRLALMDSSRRTAYTAAGSKIDALSWASEASSNGQVDGEERKGRPAWVVTSISQPVYTVCVCFGKGKKRQTDAWLSFTRPLGPPLWLWAWKGALTSIISVAFIFRFSWNQTQILTDNIHTHTHSTQTNLMLCRQGCTALTKVQHQLIDKIGFYRSFLFSHSSFCPEPADNSSGSSQKKTNCFNGWRQYVMNAFLKYL